MGAKYKQNQTIYNEDDLAMNAENVMKALN